MKKFNKIIAIAAVAALSALPFQNASAMTDSEMDSADETSVLMASQGSEEVSFATYIGADWYGVDNLIADNPKRVAIVMFGSDMYHKRKDGTLTDTLKQFYVSMLDALGCPELVTFLLLNAG